MSQLNSLNKGNYVELVESYCEVLLAQHLESATVFKGTSKAIKNDIIHSIAMVIKADIDREISAAPFIAVQADDTTDVSCQCQICHP